MTTYITQERALELSVLHPDYHGLCLAAIQQYRDSLVAGVVLPEPVAYFYHDAGSAEKANPLLHSTMFLHRSERRQNLRNETPLYTADQLRQGIADALAKQVPQGYKLVLVEPTPKMIDRGGKEIAFKTQGFGGARTLAQYSSPEVEQANRDRAEHAYRAMIAAAPAPKEQQ